MEGKTSTEKLRKQSWSGYIMFANSVLVMGSSFMYGFNASVINAPHAVIEPYINDSFAREGKILEKEELRTYWSVVVSLHLIGGLIGSIWFPTALAAAVGKKTGMMIAAVIGTAGALCSFITPWTNSYVPLMVGRGVVGFASGLDMVIAAGLINEHAPARLRGALGSLFSNGSAAGLTMANLLGLSYVLGRTDTWQCLFAFVAFCYILHGVCLFFIPDSPKDLVARGKDEEAIEAYMRLRSATRDEVIPEYELAKRNVALEAEMPNVTLGAVFSSRTLWWPMIIAINLHVAGQITGLGAAMYYATKVMHDAGLDNETAGLANFGMSFGLILGNLINLGTADRFGRRIMTLSGIAVCMAANVMLTIVIKYHVAWASSLGFAIFLIAFGAGHGCCAYYMSAEVSSRPAKTVTLAVAMFTNWSGRILVSFVFPVMQSHIGPYCFLPFAGVCFVEFFYFLFFLPETSAQLADYTPNQYGPGGSLLQLKSRALKKPSIATIISQPTCSSFSDTPVSDDVENGGKKSSFS